MPIPVICPSCGNNISAPDHVAGRTLRCFKCLNPFTVPNVVPSPAPAAPMAQRSPSFEASPAPPPMAPALFEESPAPAPPPSPEGSGADQFELAEEPTWDAPMSAAPQEDLPSTQDIRLDEAAMELAPTDEVEAPLEEAPEEVAEELEEEVAEEPVGPRKSRKVAALLALFPLSMHRFYLGYTKSAVIQIILYCVVIGWVWQVFDFLRLLFGVGFKKDGRGVPLR